MCSDIFVSYARKDIQRVVPLVEELRRLKYRVFFDVESIHIGENWKQRLERSIRSSRVLLLCWSASATSDFVRFEYLKAESLGKKVVPWLLDDTPLPAMFELQGITAADPADVAAALAKSVGWNLPRRRLLAAGIAGIVMAAGSAAWIEHTKTQGFELHGVVSDDQNLPLAGAEIVAESASALTDATGHYILNLKGLKPDYVGLRFKKTGFKEELMNVPTEGLFRMVMVRTDRR
jgi:hypothetical protein